MWIFYVFILGYLGINKGELVAYPFNAGIKSLRATLPAEMFYWGF
jgi:hypothetical protein